MTLPDYAERYPEHEKMVNAGSEFEALTEFYQYLHDTEEVKVCQWVELSKEDLQGMDEDHWLAEQGGMFVPVRTIREDGLEYVLRFFDIDPKKWWKEKDAMLKEIVEAQNG